MSTRTPNPSLFRLFAARGRRIAVAGGLTLLGVASTTTAVAAPATISPQLAPRFVGPVHWTRTSGNAHYISKVLEPSEAGSQYGATSFEWSERSDSPCWAHLRFLPLDGTLYAGKSARLNKCTKHRQSVKKVRTDAVITGVQVCLTDKSSSSKNKLKGVRLWGRTVDPETAALGPTNGPAYAERKNCAQWSRRVNCPTGEVAAKFKVFGASDTSGKHMEGISLGCREVEMRPAMQATTLSPSG